MSVDDFYASAPAAQPVVARPAPKPAPVWPWVAGAGAVVIALIAAFVVLAWPHSSGSDAPDTSTARLFGQQTRTQLPQPVTADDCSAAVKAFPKIAADARARAAFVGGCMQGG